MSRPCSACKGAAAGWILLSALAAYPEDGEPRVGGFKEAVLSVSDLGAQVRLYQEAVGWEVVHRGQAGPGQARYWHLEEDQRIEEALLCNPGTEDGYLRLVSFPGASRHLMRPGAQSWNTGGIFNINVRVSDVHRELRTLRNRGFQALTEPVEFRFGPFEVREVLVRDADGVILAMIERVEPPLEG